MHLPIPIRPDQSRLWVYGVNAVRSEARHNDEAWHAMPDFRHLLQCVVICEMPTEKRVSECLELVLGVGQRPIMSRRCLGTLVVGGVVLGVDY